MLLAQLLELTVAVTAQRNDRSGRGLREQHHRRFTLGQTHRHAKTPLEAAFHKRLRQATVGQVVSARQQAALRRFHHHRGQSLLGIQVGHRGHTT